MSADAIDKVGRDEILSIESSSSFETTVEVEEGTEIDRGYISPQFVKNLEKLIVEFENARFLVTDQNISIIKDIMPLLEKTTQLRAPLLIVAEDLTGEALATLVLNKLRGVINVAAIKSPSFGDRRKAVLQDIVLEFMTADLGMKVEDATEEQLGFARKITIAKNTTTIVADTTSKDEIQAIIAQLKKEMAETNFVYDMEKLSKKLQSCLQALLLSRLELHLKLKKYRIADAKNATFAATEEGIVPGGGPAYVHLSTFVTTLKQFMEDRDERRGDEIIQKAILASTALIADNAGEDIIDSDLIWRRLIRSVVEKILVKLRSSQGLIAL